MREVIRSSEIRTQGRLPIPDWIKENIIYSHPAFGDSVEWHYDNDMEVGVAASERLDDYTHLKRTEVINNGSSIRPPQILVDNLDGFIEGEKAVIYYSEDFKGNHVYFFSEGRFFDEIESSGGLIK